MTDICCLCFEKRIDMIDVFGAEGLHNDMHTILFKYFWTEVK